MTISADVLIRSEACGLSDLTAPYEDDPEVLARLKLEGEWPRRWMGTWRIGGGEVCWPVREMASVPLQSSVPFRGFTWRAKQGHRPGLQFMVSTGRHHGFESLEEQSLLLALDFLGASEVLPQPFQLDFEHTGGRSPHIPDFMANLPGEDPWLLDVRPGNRIKSEDALKFAATREAAAACGWRYDVVTGWRPHVHSVLDHLSSQRRPLQDQLGLQEELLDAAAAGPISFGDLAAATRLPAVARAHATHLIWHHRLGIDLGRPLGDGSFVWSGCGGDA